MNEYLYDDLQIGETADFVAPITTEMMSTFQSLSGDVNPLHVDAKYALDRGFAGPVVYGLLSSALYSKLVGVYLPGRFCLLHGIEVAFSNPAYVGESLRVAGVVSYKNDAYRVAEIKASITKMDGTRVSKAKIKVGFL